MVIACTGFDGLEVVNESWRYLVDRSYSLLTVRACAFDLLHFACRRTLPRLRYDRLTSFGCKVLLPVATPTPW